jgi:transposase
VAQNFITGDVDQSFLMPPDVRDWVDGDDLVWVVVDAVEQIDLGPLRRAYRADGHGRAAFDPAVMVAVLLLGYCLGERSSRRLERLCRRDVAFRVAARNLAPDHATIARFRARHEVALAGLFSEVLRLCAAAGLVKVGLVAVDGTKIGASASWSRNHTEAALAHQVAEAEAEFRRIAEQILAEAAQVDAAEDALWGDARGDELPVELRTRAGRLARLRAAKGRLAAEDAARRDAQRAKHDAWQERLAAGQSPGRRPHADPPKRGTGKPPRANTTDPDSRAMRCQHTLVQGYNAQAVVTADQVIVGTLLSQSATDQHHLQPTLAAAREQLTAAGIPPAITTVLADTGYATEAAFARAEDENWHLLAPLISDQQRARGEDPGGGVDPRRRPAATRAQHKLRTPQGRREYALRGRTVEPVFGQIKDQQRARQFSRRGLTACRAEWTLICTAHNLRKLHRHQRPR